MNNTYQRPATAKQIKMIVTMNYLYKYPKRDYPAGTFLGIQAASEIINWLIDNKYAATPRVAPRPSDFQYAGFMDYDEVEYNLALEQYRRLFNRLYAALAKRYPVNNIEVPVDDYQPSIETID